MSPKIRETHGRNPAKAALWFGAGLYFNSALLFLTTPVFTRLLSPGEFGQVVLYNSWSGFFGIFATLSLAAGVYNNALLEFEDHIEQYTASMLGLSTLTVTVCFGVLWAATRVAGDFTGLGTPLLVFMFAFFLFNGALQFWQAKQRFFYRYRLMVALSVIASLLGVGTSIVLMIGLPEYRVESRIMAAAAPNLIIGIVLYLVGFRRGALFYSGRYWGYALSMNIPLLPHYLSQACVLQFDRLAIEQLSGKSDVGIYGLAGALASGVTLFWTAINASWLPWMLKKLRDVRITDISARATDLSWAVAGICILLALATPEAVSILAPPSYHAAIWVVPVLLVASFIQFTQSIFLTVQFYRKRAATIMTCSVLAAGANAGLNLAGIAKFGFIAAAYVIVLTNLLQLLFHGLSVTLRDRVSVINSLQLAMMLGITAGFSALSICFANDQWVRGSLFAGVALLWLTVAWRRFAQMYQPREAT